MLYENTYLYNFNIWNADKKKKLDIYNLKDEYFNFCVKKGVENCKQYSDKFYECQECFPGYSLTIDKQCTNQPEEIIENCLEYLRENECRECFTGFYLESPELCLPHTKTVDLCLKMSKNIKDECSEC